MKAAVANPATTNKIGSAPSRRSSEESGKKPRLLPLVGLLEGRGGSHGSLNLQGAGTRDGPQTTAIFIGSDRMVIACKDDTDFFSNTKGLARRASGCSVSNSG